MAQRALRLQPHLAAPADAQRLLKSLEKHSAQFCARIEPKDSVGIIEIGAVR
jgi:hypothetical protein